MIRNQCLKHSANYLATSLDTVISRRFGECFPTKVRSLKSNVRCITYTNMNFSHGYYWLMKGSDERIHTVVIRLRAYPERSHST